MSNSAVSFVTLTGNDRLDALLVSLKWGKPGTTPATVTYSFAGLGSSWSYDQKRGYGPEDGGREPWREGYDQLDSVQRKNVKLALAEFSKVSGLTFVEVRESLTAVGDIRFAFTSGIDGFSQSYAPTPNPVGGDIWISDKYENATFKPGTSEFAKLLSSIGQSVGLWRPDRSNPPLDLEYDHIGNTIMSTAAGPRGYTPVTLMALDVAALTYLYGPNPATAGNTTHVISNANSYNKYRYIADAGGTDTLVFTDRAYVVDLAAGFATTTPSNSNPVILGYEPPPTSDDGLGPMLLSGLRGNGEAGSYHNIVFAPGTIENVDINQSSTIYGDNRSNIVRYVEDFVKWSFYFDGRGGVDTVSVMGRSSEFTLAQNGSLLTFTRQDPVEEFAKQKINITNVEIIKFSDRSFYFDPAGNNKLQVGGSAPNQLKGTGFTDYLYGGRSSDQLYGDGGNDHLFGGLMRDHLDGGAGFDTVHYDDVSQGNLTIRLDENPGAVSPVSPDRYVSIEGVVGGAGNDDIGGTSGANRLNGMGGNDILRGKAGADIFVFDTKPGSGNIDRLADFSAVDDTIWLARSIFTTLAGGKLGSGAFKDLSVAGAAADKDDRILYNKSTGALFYDADGSGKGGALQIATVDTKATLTAADFFVF